MILYDPAMCAADGNSEAQGPRRGSVAGGVLCVSCGYDLRGLPIDANCPECGTPAERSLAGDELAGADTTWLRRIVCGQRILAWGWLLILMVPASLIATIFLLLAAPRLEPHFAAASRVIMIIFGRGGLLLAAIGIVLVTIQDPRETLHEGPWAARRLARIGMIGAAALYIASLPMQAIISDAAMIVRPILLLGALAAFTVGIVCFLRWLATLLNRVPDVKRVKEATQLARFLRWGLPLAVVLIALAPTPGRGPGRTRIEDILTTIAGCTGSVLLLILVAKCVSLAILFFKACGAFHRCLAQAQMRAESTERSPLTLRSSASQRV